MPEHGPEHMAGHPAYRNGYRALGPRRQPTLVLPAPPVPPPQPVTPPVAPPLPQRFPQPFPPIPAPRRPRRGTMIALTALAVVFLAAAGVFAALFVGASGDHAAAADRLDQRRAELADLDGRVGAANAEKQRAQRRNTGLASENTELTPCVDTMRHYLFDNPTGADLETTVDKLFTLCQ